MEIVRTEAEVDELINRCVENNETVGSVYPGMTYEQGIRAGIEWLTGETDDYPFD